MLIPAFPVTTPTRSAALRPNKGLTVSVAVGEPLDTALVVSAQRGHRDCVNLLAGGGFKQSKAQVLMYRRLV